MKWSVLILCLLVCKATILFSQQSGFPELTGPYLGQEPPGMTPEIFAPGVISSAGFVVSNVSFSPDGKEFYFHRQLRPGVVPTACFTRMENETWTSPAQLQIVHDGRLFHPSISDDNHWLLFYWQFTPDQKGKSGYYASARTDTGWSVPKYAGEGRYLTYDDTGQYYAAESVWSDQPEFYLVQTALSNGIFTGYERLNIHPYQGKQLHPCIAKDGSYIIFDIYAENSGLFVSFRNKNGVWGEAKELSGYGFKPGASGAYISPDGKYLFYTDGGNLWWVSTQIMDGLRPEK